MHYLQQQIRALITTYGGAIPLAHVLKNHFKTHQKLGSRDRRIISAALYSWYRCAKTIKPVPDIENEDQYKDALRYCMQACHVQDNLIEKLFGKASDVAFETDINELLANCPELSDGIGRSEWLQSMLVQPNLFIRIRRNKAKVLQLLTQAGIGFTEISPACISLPNGAAINNLLPATDYVVQDASSQRTGSYFLPKPGEHWYDVCSGAGGKALLLSDMGVSIHLTVSDRRKTILHNLEERFSLYGLKQPNKAVADATQMAEIRMATGGQLFDHIICDVPCSGSGTWARTPEQLYFFDAMKVAEFATLQKTIAINAVSVLKPGGTMYYITCSLFKEENEHVVAAIEKATGLETLRMNVINGIAIGADCMFIAELRKQP